MEVEAATEHSAEHRLRHFGEEIRVHDKPALQVRGKEESLRWMLWHENLVSSTTSVILPSPMSPQGSDMAAAAAAAARCFETAPSEDGLGLSWW